MAKSDTKTGSGRRDFLKLAALGGPVAAAAAVTGATETKAAPAKTQLGYSETAHVKAYLDSCRF